MAIIHMTARVDPRAEIADDVEIGPYCIVGPEVTIGRGTRLMSHVLLMGSTSLGESNLIGPSVIGGDPQDTSFRGSATRVEVGDHNVVREGVTIHRASEKDDGVTRVGSHNVLLAGAHVAHDCKLADRISLGEGAMLGGHVHVESYVILSAGVAVVHNVTVGTHCFVGEKSKITQDVPRYMRVDGNPSGVRSINVMGLRRNGVCKGAIDALREAHRLIYRAKLSVEKAASILEAHGQLSAEVIHLLEFRRAQQRGRNGRARDRDRDCESPS